MKLVRCEISLVAGGRREQCRRAVTQIELLIVLSVIALLLAILLPAVQSARAAARRTTCQNHLRQIGAAALNHESAHGHFPTNGWGYRWLGDPTRGHDQRQPGGWIYNLLPFLDQAQAVRDANVDRLVTIAWPVFRCPDRPGDGTGPANLDVTPFNGSAISRVAKTDYAINEGDWISDTGPGPATLVEGDDPSYSWKDMTPATGVSFLRSRVRAAHILDGLSHTYLVGEKYVSRSAYNTADDLGYDQSMLTGVDLDLNRWSHFIPMQDADGSSPRRFGSAHPHACHFVFCDGSVQRIAYGIDREIHRAHGNRMDLLSH